MALTAGDPIWYYKVLGLHCDGANNSTTFTDVKGKTVTAAGNAKISTAQYPSLTGKSSSGYVDGTGDYLTVPDSADWDFGTGDFGVRIRARFSGVSTLQALISNYQNSTTGFSMVFDGVNSKLQFLNGTTALLDVAWSPSANTWYVIDVSRSGTSLRGFVDGTQVGSTATDSTSITGSTSTLFVGARDASNQLLTGYFSEVEVYKGAPINTANYTPSSDPFPDTYVRVSGTTKDAGGSFASMLVRVYRRDTGALVEQVVSDATTGEYAVTAANSGAATPLKHVAYMHNTEEGVYIPWRVLGLHCDGANNSTTFSDVTGKTVTANGNAKISTSQSVFGGASGYCDGTGDWLGVATSADFNFGSANFTVRGRFRCSDLSTYRGVFSVWGDGAAANRSWSVWINSNLIQASISTNGTTQTNAFIETPTIVVDTWYDIELSRSGSSLYLFLEGTSLGTPYNIGTTALYGPSSELQIGMAGGSAPYIGWFDEIEIYKGVALHTANFTPSGGPFPDALGDVTENAIIYDNITPY